MIRQYFEFRTLITPFWIQLSYLMGAFGITMISVMAIIAPHTFAGYDNDTKHIVASGAILLFVGNIIWRMLCEGVILFFSIHSLLVSIDNRAESLATAEVTQTE